MRESIVLCINTDFCAPAGRPGRPGRRLHQRQRPPRQPRRRTGKRLDARRPGRGPARGQWASDDMLWSGSLATLSTTDLGRAASSYAITPNGNGYHGQGVSHTGRPPAPSSLISSTTTSCRSPARSQRMTSLSPPAANPLARQPFWQLAPPKRRGHPNVAPRNMPPGVASPCLHSVVATSVDQYDQKIRTGRTT